MKTKELFQRGKIILRSLAAAGGIYLAVRYSRECYKGIEKGVSLCLGMLIPSLFFFMVVAAYLVQSGFAELISKPLGGISQRLFRLPAQSMAAILLSMIGGYPVGAACAEIMCKEKQLSPTQAAKTAYIAVAAGPGFLLSYIGMTLLNSKAAGNLLLAAQAAAVIVTGIIVGHTVKSEPLPHPGSYHQKSGNLLVSAVKNASRAAFGMCAMVTVFCALSEIIDTVIRDPAACNIAAAIIEITNGCSRICGHVPLYVTAFFVGFGGLSVHFQIFAALDDVPVNKGLFFLFRITEGIIAMAAAYIYLMAFPMTTEVFSSLQELPAASRSATAAGSAALVISSVLFIGSIAKKSDVTEV